MGNDPLHDDPSGEAAQARRAWPGAARSLSVLERRLGRTFEITASKHVALRPPLPAAVVTWFTTRSRPITRPLGAARSALSRRRPRRSRLMITLLGEFGKEHGPPFLQGSELSPELLQVAVDLRQFGPRVPFPQVSITMPALTRSSTSRRSSRSHGFPCIAAGRYWSLPASIAAKISSCVSPHSERAVLSLSVAPLRPHSSALNSIAGHYLPGRN
jgi:hypothetical protein